MMNTRLKFTKGNEVKYISHLDLMRVFQRAIRRSEVPIAYSAGFNPHQEISFGAPLSLGVTSNAEYVDLKLSSEMAVQEIKERLNGSLPDGIRILDGVVLGDNPKSAMSLVTHARYMVSFYLENISPEALEKSLRDFLVQDSIKVMKEQPKKGFELKEVDIRPMIVDMKLVESKTDFHIFECLLLSGSKGNLKPELLMKAFGGFGAYNIEGKRINREE
ncbi:MAG TPA: TIGR03936 family radical SAM-associated protein, partial [Negativicutes bacterium]|nr:TIGR03936 family radical SAM-associated protein [Negativicutes bacterium]